LPVGAALAGAIMGTTQGRIDDRVATGLQIFVVYGFLFINFGVNFTLSAMIGMWGV
jgi:hypothetical protein